MGLVNYLRAAAGDKNASCHFLRQRRKLPILAWTDHQKPQLIQVQRAYWTLWIRIQYKLPWLLIVLLAANGKYFPHHENTTSSVEPSPPMKRYPRTTFLNTQGNHQGRQLAFADWKNSSREKRLISYHEYIHPGYDPERPLCKSNDASCELMGEWQEAYHPTCNFFHEIDLATPIHDARQSNQWVAQGYYRDVWKIFEYDASARRALKTLRYSHEYSPDRFKRHRRDAIAYDVLTSSPYVANIYGFCSNSALHDFSDDGDLSKLFDSNNNPSKEELLRIAHRLVSSVSDAHHVDERGRATMVHNDIKPNQWIRIDGEFRLNDFNRNKLLTWNPLKNATTKFYFSDNQGKWRSPEEYAKDWSTEKVDIWSLGMVLYFLHSRASPFGNFPDLSSIYEFVKEGGHPIIEDESILRSKHPFDVAILKSMKRCLVKDIDQRASAREVQDIFVKALKQIV